MSTWYLAPTRTLAQERQRQIAEHEKAVEERYKLVDAVTSAIDTLRRRIEATADPALRAVLEHNEADLEAYREELNREGEQHDKAIKQLWAQK